MMISASSSSQGAGGGVVSSSSAIVRVEKATSEFLIGPDWTMNIDICDTLNSNHWLAKDVVRAVKKRLLHKNPKVQMLALTLLETMVKNCGDYVHFQVADRNILQEMVKIVKKKTDMHVRDKILVLLDSWQEAFGGPGGKYPQYYWAYEELRRMGVDFPKRSLDTAPIFTPPITHPPVRHPHPGYGMPNNSSTRLDEAMAAEMETLSLSSMSAMRNALDLLSDMLQAVNPTDQLAVKDEVIVDLVEQCRSNQKKLMQMLTTTGDEELLAQGLELNDNLQIVLARHDTIASGSPLPTHVTNGFLQSNAKQDSSPKPADVTTASRTSNGDSSSVPTNTNQTNEEEEEEDDFALLARRHSKTNSATPLQNGEVQNAVSNGGSMNSQESSSSLVMEKALVLAEPPVPARTTKEQDIIDLLSITLSDIGPSDAHNVQAPSSSEQNLQEGTTPSGHGNNSVGSQAAFLGNQTQGFSSYVAPWALPQQQQFQPSGQREQLVQNPNNLRSHQQSPQYYRQVQPQSQVQSTVPQYSSVYPPPPWAATPGYFSNPNPVSRHPYAYSPAQPTSPISSARASQDLSPMVNGDASRIGTTNPTTSGQKPFIPSYRLFEDLNVLGNNDGRFKMTNNPSSSLSGTHNQSMVGGGK